MCSSKTKTALPAATGKAAVETGISVCVCVPAPIISQNEAFDQSLFWPDTDKPAHGLARWLGCAPYIIIEVIT